MMVFLHGVVVFAATSLRTYGIAAISLGFGGFRWLGRCLCPLSVLRAHHLHLTRDRFHFRDRTGEISWRARTRDRDRDCAVLPPIAPPQGRSRGHSMGAREQCRENATMPPFDQYTAKRRAPRREHPPRAGDGSVARREPALELAIEGVVRMRSP